MRVRQSAICAVSNVIWCCLRLGHCISRTLSCNHCDTGNTTAQQQYIKRIQQSMWSMFNVFACVVCIADSRQFTEFSERSKGTRREQPAIAALEALIEFVLYTIPRSTTYSSHNYRISSIKTIGFAYDCVAASITAVLHQQQKKQRLPHQGIRLSSLTSRLQLNHLFLQQCRRVAMPSDGVKHMRSAQQHQPHQRQHQSQHWSLAMVAAVQTVARAIIH